MPDEEDGVLGPTLSEMRLRYKNIGDNITSEPGDYKTILATVGAPAVGQLR